MIFFVLFWSGITVLCYTKQTDVALEMPASDDRANANIVTLFSRVWQALKFL